MKTDRQMMIIRAGNQSDVANIAELFESVPENRADLSFISANMAQYPSMVAYDESVLVAFAYCCKMSTEILEIANLFVRESYRGRGIGGDILQTLVSASMKEYANVILTNIHSADKVSARAFYESHGFKCIVSTGTGFTDVFWH